MRFRSLYICKGLLDVAVSVSEPLRKGLVVLCVRFWILLEKGSVDLDGAVSEPVKVWPWLRGAYL